MLFDLDGTLIDHDSAAAVALTRALEATPGLSHLDHERARHRWRELENLAMDRYLAGDLTFTGQRRLRVTSIAAELGLGTWDNPRTDAWFASYLRHYEAAWCAYDDVQPALRALAVQRPGLTIGVLTNGDADQQHRKLRRTGLTAGLSEVIVSSTVGAAKPDARIFHHGCTRLRLSPAEVVYVGDRLHTDAIAATNAGLHGIWLNRSNDPPHEDISTIGTLGDLPAVLAEIDR
ncbi:HAD family hydrolase [Actinoplanes sp. M2I2]|uniref:HAD family hydrolase n=1 Tax=Actinoplanes sp. M2I2 TaxID=1734444 RepID=UPI002020218E|nr:HAD family hydrolase [Actinoplanes sp. M2I2]